MKGEKWGEGGKGVRGEGGGYFHPGMIQIENLPIVRNAKLFLSKCIKQEERQGFQSP